MYDTPTNGLINAGLTEGQVGMLGEKVAIALYTEVVELTYPNAIKRLKEMKESGEYKEPTEFEIKQAKKNSS